MYTGIDKQRERPSQSGGELKRLNHTLRGIIAKVALDDQHGDLQRNIIADVEQQVASLPEEDPGSLYDRINEIFTVFFGVETSETEEIAAMVRTCIQTVFSDLFEEGKATIDIAGMNIADIRGNVHAATQRILREASERNFNPAEFIRTKLFQKGEEVVERETLKQRFDASKAEMQPEDAQAIGDCIEKMSVRLPRISKKGLVDAVKNGAKNAVKKNGGEPPLVARLKELEAFLNAVENRRMVLSDFHAVDYLRHFVDGETAMQLIGTGSHPMTQAVVTARFNGDLLKKDPFVNRMEREAHAQATVHAMTDRDFNDIAQGLIKIATGEMNIDEITLRTGIGGSDKDVPLRILSYMISSLTIARRLKEKFGTSPKVELFTGEEGGIACNDLDPDKTRKNTNQAFAIIERFVKKFFPGIKDKFSLVPDKEWSDPKIQLVIAYFEQLLTRLMAEDSKLAKIRQELEGRGTKYGGETGKQRALQYAAFHIICFQDIPAVTQYLDGVASDRTNIISIGGRAERDFDAVRDALTENFSVKDFNRFAAESGRPDLQIQEPAKPLAMRSTLIADTGKIPPYTLAEAAGDITLAELNGLSPGELRGLFGERMRRALEIFRESNGHATLSPAKDASSSFIQGMTMIASVVPPDELVEFIHNFTHEEQR